MTIENLRKVIKPPTEPVESGVGEDWSKVEHNLGTMLPSDYKEYINTYGTGQIGNFVLPLNPFSKNDHINLIRQATKRLDALRQIKEKHGNDESPYPLFPAREGLLPWGITDNGDVLYWLTTGSPEEWTVAINESRGPMFEEYEMSMTNFLSKLIKGEIASEILPDGFLDANTLFQPLR